MPYTDLQNVLLSKLAYFDLEDKYEYYTAFGVEKVSLDKLLDNSQKKQLEALCGGNTDEFNTLLKTWSLAGACDTNDDNGFCAYIVETGADEAAVAFRGSDDMGDPAQWINDWVKGDMALLTQTETTQHQAVREFIRQTHGTLSKYKALNVTGHSLGGNLAEYFTIVSDEYGLDDNIERCVALDSPGFSTEFLIKHRKQIRKMNADNKMVHYQWSLVGGLLQPVQSSLNNLRYADVKAGMEDHAFKKHQLQNVKLDGSSFDTTDTPPSDALSWSTTILTKAIDWVKLFNRDFRMYTIGIVGIVAILGTFKEFLDGSIRERYLMERAQNLAVREAAANPEIYIDTDAYDQLAKDCATASKKLAEIANEIWARRGGRPFSAPTIGRFDIPIVSQIVSAINWIDEMLNTTAYCGRRVEESANAMEQIGDYFKNTSEDFKEAERTALNMAKAWLESVGIEGGG